jgi:hypothetical protein
MTVASPLVEQQRAVIELYIHSKWIKANLTLEDEHLFLEYAIDKRDQPTPTEQFNNNATIHEISDTISSQKRFIKITKPENTGLGKKFHWIYFHFLYISNRN